MVATVISVSIGVFQALSYAKTRLRVSHCLPSPSHQAGSVTVCTRHGGHVRASPCPPRLSRLSRAKYKENIKEFSEGLAPRQTSRKEVKKHRNFIWASKKGQSTERKQHFSFKKTYLEGRYELFFPWSTLPTPTPRLEKTAQ